MNSYPDSLVGPDSTYIGIGIVQSLSGAQSNGGHKNRRNAATILYTARIGAGGTMISTSPVATS
jgi:hypothetical protein